MSSYRIRKIGEVIENEYFSDAGEKHINLSGNNNQENQTTEEINDDMETQDQENFQPGQDNLIVDKMDTFPSEQGTILAKLKELDILLIKENKFASDIVRVVIRRLKDGSG